MRNVDHIVQCRSNLDQIACGKKLFTALRHFAERLMISAIAEFPSPLVHLARLIALSKLKTSWFVHFRDSITNERRNHL